MVESAEQFEEMPMFFRSVILMLFAVLSLSAQTLHRTTDGKPNLQGIWQVRNRAAVDLLDHAAKAGMPPGKGVVEGGTIPYQPWAAAKKLENFKNRQTADPLAQCFM